MSVDINPDALTTSDVAEATEPAANWSEKSLVELVQAFEELLKNEDRLKMYKEAEAIKAAFYKKLIKEKAEAGYVSTEVEDATEEAAAETLVTEEREDPFSRIEEGFKEIYASYKKERAEYNRQQEQEREQNLALKEAVIADLKLLVEKQEDVNATFPEFREIQNRWRVIGPVPATNFRNLNETYQLYVEQFYDKVKINRELRDLDFKKNLEAKENFCVQAEQLAERPNIVEAFKELQKLHDQWKEYGPVAKEFREPIWERFKAATAVINRKYQAYFEEMKEHQTENLEKKTKLCEQVEEIAAREVPGSNEWNAFSKEIEDIQKVWKTIGFASKKENQKIYDRFRAACDAFYSRKREFYSSYKDSMNENLEKKIALCEQAEALKTSTDWKKTTDEFIALQKQWKEIGAVPRKKSEALWKRFRSACDEFFNERDKQAKPENDFYGNLRAKKKLVEEIKAYVLTGDEAKDKEAMHAFMNRWQEIGFVPFKEKDNIMDAYRAALREKFPHDASRKGGRNVRGPRTEKERLIQKYTQLQQDIVTYENNVGFFEMSRNAAPLISQLQEKIVKAKEELEVLAGQIRSLEEE